MAEKDVFKSKLSTSSDVVVECPCIQRSREDRPVDAVKLCVECNELLCEVCIHLHREMDHQIVEQPKKRQSFKRGRLKSSFTEKCPKHRGNLLETYCRDHGHLCCRLCFSISHKDCVDVITLPEAAEGIANSKEISDILTRIAHLDNNVKALKRVRQGDTDRVEKDRQDAIQAVKEHRIRILAELDRLEKDFYAELDVEANQCARSTATDIGLCDDLLRELEGVTKDIKTATASKDDVQLFVNIKNATAKCTESESNYAKMSKNKYKETHKYIIDSRAENAIRGMHRLGSFKIVKREVKIGSLLGQYAVTIQTDQNKPGIVGTALLSNGQMVLADEDNMKLKIVDESVNIIGSISLTSKPRGMCLISENVACVSYQEEKTVEFVSLDGTKPLLTPIFVGKACRGVAYSGSELFVAACGPMGDSEVRVYSTDGRLIRNMEKDDNGRRLFSEPYYITTNNDGSRIHVSDSENGVITLDRYGKVIWVYNKLDMKRAMTICVDHNDNLYVCGRTSCNVLKISADGQTSAVVLTKANGLQEWPMSICYDYINDRLIVTQWRNKALVFEMK